MWHQFLFRPYSKCGWDWQGYRDVALRSPEVNQESDLHALNYMYLVVSFLYFLELEMSVNSDLGEISANFRGKITDFESRMTTQSNTWYLKSD